MDLVDGGQDKLYSIDPLIARLPSLRDKRVVAPDAAKSSEQQIGLALLHRLLPEDFRDTYGRGLFLTRDALDVSGAIWALPTGAFTWAIRRKRVVALRQDVGKLPRSRQVTLPARNRP